MSIKNLYTFLLFVLIFANLTYAEPVYRGFQIGTADLSDEEILSLGSEWKANVIRIQVGNDSLMDGRTGADYFQMISDSLDQVDLLLPKFDAQSIKVILTLYSPPGGFQTRKAPSHYAMFSELALQQDFINVWELLALRYKDNSTVLSYDLSNEPALRKSLFNRNALTWPELVKDTVTAIRAIDPVKQIIIKALYGNPTQLRFLPKIKDPNYCYSFHVYPDNKYINQGINGNPIKHNPPSNELILKNSFLPIHKLLKKFPKKDRKDVCFNIGEFAVPRWAPKADLYLERLLKLIERSKIPATERQPATKINLQSWTYHAYDESPVWDPRGSTNPNNETFPAELPARAEVLVKYMLKNQ